MPLLQFIHVISVYRWTVFLLLLASFIHAKRKCCSLMKRGISQCDKDPRCMDSRHGGVFFKLAQAAKPYTPDTI